MKLSIIHWLFKWILTYLKIFTLSPTVVGFNFTKEFFGVGHSPYVKIYEDYDGIEIVPSLSSYSYDFILSQVRLMSKKFGFLVTFGMDTEESSLNKPWWEGNAAAAFVMRAAAQVNLESKDNTTRITVIQGVYQKSNKKHLEYEEIKRAFDAAEEANRNYSGTVYGISIFSLFNLDDEDMGKLRITYRQHRNKAKQLGLAIGTRLHKCDDVLKNETRSQYIKNVAKMSDFVLCSIFPAPGDVHFGPEFNVEAFGEKFMASRKILLKENPRLKIYNGETGWPSKGPSYNGGNATSNTMNNTYAFWKALNKWATMNQIPVVAFEAFDEPWKSSLSVLDPNNPGGKYGAEGHYGWWRLRNNSDPFSFYEKYLEPSEYIPIKVPEKTDYKKSNQRENQISQTAIVTILGILALCTLMLVQLVANLFKKLRDQKKEKPGLTQKEIDEFMKGTLQPVDSDQPLEEAVRLPYNSQCEISQDKLVIDKDNVLGSGNFGIVYKGRVSGLKDEVAWKTARNEHLSALRGVLAEIKVMSYVGTHENIVKFIGAYTAEISQGIVYLAVELCPLGSLDQFLRTNQSTFTRNIVKTKMENDIIYSDVGDEEELGFKTLCKWAFQISKGMEYLSGKKVIHADLATRNVLLSTDRTAKITDFGLSRRMYEYTEYVKSTQELLPWRWMAIESLKKMSFSPQSDVWAYGITLWELFSLGDIPYPGLAWDINFVLKLEEGMRMTSPKYATPEIYEMMKRCWNIEPKLRHTFVDLVEFTGKLQQNTVGLEHQ